MVVGVVAAVVGAEVGLGVGAGALWGAVVVGAGLRVVVVTPRPAVVLGPSLVDGPLVVEPATVVDDDDGACTTISLGWPGPDPGSPAMATPTTMLTASDTTMPARFAAGPCQSMAVEPRAKDFFRDGSIRGPTDDALEGPNSNGPVTPYEVGPRAAKARSNTVPTRRQTR